MEEQTINIIEIGDGYHQFAFYFEDGRMMCRDEQEFMDFLCKPHTERFIVSKIFSEELDEYSDDSVFLALFEDMNRNDRIKNFPKVLLIYKKLYLED